MSNCYSILEHVLSFCIERTKRKYLWKCLRNLRKPKTFLSCKCHKVQRLKEKTIPTRYLQGPTLIFYSHLHHSKAKVKKKMIYFCNMRSSSFCHKNNLTIVFPYMSKSYSLLFSSQSEEMGTRQGKRH